MKNTNQKQSAITLIVLVITIAIMLILVGVVINITLNGGLFDRANEAVEKTDIAQTKEKLQEKIVAEQAKQR